MKLKLIKTSIFFLSIQFSSYSFSAGTQCILYEHNDSQGHSLTIPHQVAFENFDKFMIQRRSWHGHIWGWRGRDVSFERQASSFYIEAGCRLSVWTGRDFTGNYYHFPNFPANDIAISQNLDAYGFNDSISSAQCNCKGTYDKAEIK